MRPLMASLAILALLAPGVPRRAMGSPRLSLFRTASEGPTAGETRFTHVTMTPWTAPYATMVPGSSQIQYAFDARLQMALDSHETLHVVQVVQDTNSSRIIYQNDKPENRRANGFSDPLTIQETVRDFNPPFDDTKADSIQSLTISVDTSDTIHVVWMQLSIRAFPYLQSPGRLYHRSCSGGAWGSVTKLTPEFNETLPAAAYPRTTIGFSYGTPRYSRTPSGHIYYATQVTAAYEYIVPHPSGGDPITKQSFYYYNMYGSDTGGFQIIDSSKSTVRIDSDGFSPIEVPDEIESIFGFAVDVGGQPMLLWTENTYGTGVLAYKYGPPGSGQPLSLDFGVLHMFYDAHNQLHLYGNVPLSGPNDLSPRARYRSGPGMPTQFLQGITFVGEVLLDSDDNHYFIPGEEGLSGQVGTIYRRSRDAFSGTLAAAFSPIGFVDTSLGGLRNQNDWGRFNSGVHGALLSKSNRLFVPYRDSCAYSAEAILGARDSATLRPVFPGGRTNVLTGNLMSTIPLYATSGAGPCQSLSLIYNSLESRYGIAGAAWRLSAEVQIIDHYQFVKNPNNPIPVIRDEVYTLVQPSGRRIVFGENEAVAAGCFDKLERVSLTSLQSEYKLTTKTGEVFWFNTDGRLRRMEDPAGCFMEYFYDGAGRLTQIKDMNGQRTASIEYGATTSAGARVVGVTDPANRHYSLAYSGDHLSSVTFDSGPQTPQYEFEYYLSDDASTGARRDLMSKFRTPRAKAGNYAWTCLYHPNGRLKTVRDPSEKHLKEGDSDETPASAAVASESFSYDGSGRTLVTDRRGYRTLFVGSFNGFFVNEIHDTAILESFEAFSTIFPTLRTFDFSGNLVEVKDRWGFSTSYSYSNFLEAPFVGDNLLEVRRPKADGTGQDLVAKYTYTADGFSRVKTATTYVTPTGGGPVAPRTTTYDYNDRGQLVQVNHPDVTLADGSDQSGVTTKYEYNGPRNQLSRITNEENAKTDFLAFDSLLALPTTVLREGGTQPTTVAYDVMGNLVQQTQPRGSVENELPAASQTILDNLYRVASTVDPAGRVTTYEYDVDSNLVKVTPPAGGFTTTAYDKRGFVTGGTSPDGTWAQEVDANGNVRRSTDLRGFASHVRYDFMGRTVRATSPGASTLPGGEGGGGVAQTTLMEYDLVDGDGHFSRSTAQGAVDRVTRTHFDNRGRARRVTAPDNNTKSETFYNELDQVIASQQVFGTEVQSCSVTFRDARDRVIRVREQNTDFRSATLDQHRSTCTIHNRAGSVVKSVDPLGDPTVAGHAHKTTYVRDVRERVDSVIDGKGVVVLQYFYGDDDLVRETRVPDPTRKNSTAMVTASVRAYSARKELLTERDLDGHGPTYTYGALPGQVATVTDASGSRTHTYYDSNTQRVDRVVEAEGTLHENQTKHTWANGLLTEIKVHNPATGAYDATFTRTYDQAGRLERTQAPGVVDERYFYNGFGESLMQVTGAKVVVHGYNTLGQLTTSTWHGAYSAQHTYTYNGAGQMETASDGALTKTTFYERWKGTPHTESIAVAGAPWKAQGHTFDHAGNQTAFTDGEGVSHEWPVDENNRPTKVRYANQTSREILYTTGGLVDQEILKDAAGSAIATTVHSYDRLGRRTNSETIQNGTGEVLTDYGWDYDSRNLISAVHLRHLGASVSFGLDARGRPATEATAGNNGGQTAPAFENEYGDAPTGTESTDKPETSNSPRNVIPVPARSASYTFSAGGNRQSAVIDGVPTSYTYNAANQLVSETSSVKTVTHEYDDLGNETKRTSIPAATPENPNPTPTVERYGYNHLNLLASYTNSATNANWQYDFYPSGERYGKTDLNTASSELYVPKFGDVSTEYTKLGESAPVLKNSYVQGLGIDSKRIRVSLGGARRHYLGDQVGTLGMTIDDAGNPLETIVKDAWGVPVAGGSTERYSGLAQREQDTESGLTYMRHRMYDPKLGRFTQCDPLLGNRPSQHYAYAGNNPVSFRDPTGQYLELSNEEAEKLGEKGKAKIIDLITSGFDDRGAKWHWEGNRLAGADRSNLGLLAPNIVDPNLKIDFKSFARQVQDASNQYASIRAAGRTVEEDLSLTPMDRQFLQLSALRQGVEKIAIGALILQTLASGGVMLADAAVTVPTVTVAQAAPAAVAAGTAASSPQGQQALQRLQQLAQTVNQAPQVITRVPTTAQLTLSNSAFNFSAQFSKLTNNEIATKIIGAKQTQLLTEWFGRGVRVFRAGEMPEGISLETLRAYHELARRALENTGDIVQSGRLQLIEDAIRAMSK